MNIVNRRNSVSKDVKIGLGFMVGGILMLIYTYLQDWRLVRVSAGLTPATIPFIAGAVIAVSGGFIALIGYFGIGMTKVAQRPSIRTVWPTLAQMLSWIVCGVLLHYVGFTLAAYIGTVVSMYMWGVRKWTTLIFLSLIIVLVISLLFHYVLGAQLPEPLIPW